MNQNEIEFLAIGDTVVDAFIKLSNAHIEEADHVNYEEQQLCMPFASKIPYESVTIVPAVGNSANAAVSAARLGLRSGLVTFLGNDVNGRECLFNLERENVNTAYITPEIGAKTNYHYVLWYKDERTILIKHEKYTYKLPPLHKPKWIYLSSLGEDGESINYEVAEFLKKNTDVKLAFQPGTFQMKLGIEKLKDIYSRSEVFFCNVEEAMLILNTKERDLHKLLDGVANLGPKIVVITDGKRGSFMKSDNEYHFMPIYPDKNPPYERTGAGDAFASTFTAMLSLGKTPLEALKYAPINSMSVVQQIGAQAGLLKLKAIEEYLNNAPADYVAVKF